MVSFKVGNTGSDALDVWSALPGEGVELVISLALCVPDVEPLTAETALAALDGEYSSKFSWSYDTATAVFTGRQIASIPASGVGLITLAIRVTRNSASTQVGFSTTLTPPNMPARATPSMTIRSVPIPGQNTATTGMRRLFTVWHITAYRKIPISG